MKVAVAKAVERKAVVAKGLAVMGLAVDDGAVGDVVSGEMKGLDHAATGRGSGQVAQDLTTTPNEGPRISVTERTKKPTLKTVPWRNHGQSSPRTLKVASNSSTWKTSTPMRKSTTRN